MAEREGYGTVRDQYDAMAAEYDRRWSYYTYATVTAAADALDCRGPERVLDIACGTGELARLLLAQCPALRITGLDLSREMLATAHAKLRRNPRVGFVCATLPTLPFADAAFDTVVCTNAFHYFAEPARACAEFARVLRPGGRCVIVDWCHDYWTCKLCEWYLRLADPAHHRMYTARRCTSLLEAGGLRVRSADRFKISLLWGLMTIVGTRASGAAEV